MPRKDGPLEDPEFDALPMPHRQIYHKRKFAYQRAIDVVREHPGNWARIGTYAEGGKKASMRAVQNARNSVRAHLDTHAPDELWIVKTRTRPETWCTRELWVICMGHDPAGAAEELQRRREIVARLMSAKDRNRADREAQARIDALNVTRR